MNHLMTKIDYGVQAALDREEQKKANKKKLQEKKGPPKPLVPDMETLEKKKKRKTDPHINLYPLSNESAKHQKEDLKPEIDWNDESTLKNSSDLASMLTTERQDSTSSALLSMGTGTGKTSSAVSTIGKLQHDLNKTIPFIVTSKSNIINGRGWQRTIKQWNVDHPDNQLHPVLIESVDRFANICANAKSLKKVIDQLDIKDSVIICDEVQLYKSPTSKRSKKLQKLSSIKKLGLSGTLITNDAVFDMGSYLILTGFYNNKTDFIHRTKLAQFISRWGLGVYNKDGSINKTKWPQYEDVINQYSSILLQPDTSRIDDQMPDIKKKVIQLPYNEDLEADMKSLGRALHHHVFEDYSDYFMEFVKRLHSDQQRLDKLIEIIRQDHVKQPIIFYHNVVVKEYIEKALLENGYTDWQEISGQSKPFEEFDHDNLNPVLAQYISAAEGIELKNSNTTIFYQNQRRADILTQAKGRNRRLGMEGSIENYYILADDQNDQYIYDISLHRQNVEQEVMMDAFIKNLKQKG